MTNKTEWQETVGVFPIPVYVTKSNSDLTSKEEIENIIQEGIHKSAGNSKTNNSYIFDKNLKELKQFCEQHLKKYVEEIINPKEELDFYITQSWLNINKPGEFHHEHSHSNSIISGVFYISNIENDKITLMDPNSKIKDQIHVSPKAFTPFNSTCWFFPVHQSELILFPS